MSANYRLDRERETAASTAKGRKTIPPQNILSLALCLCHERVLDVFGVAAAAILLSQHFTVFVIDLVARADCSLVPSTEPRQRLERSLSEASLQFQLLSA